MHCSSVFLFFFVCIFFVFLLLCKFCAIVFGLENLNFLAKIHIFIPKCTEEEGGKSNGLGNVPKNFFFSASLKWN